MKEYQNYLFDLYGTLVDIHTDEDDLRLWQRMAVLLAQEGICCSAQQLKTQYCEAVARLEGEAKASRGVGAEISIGPVFAAFYAGTGITPEDRHIAFLAHTFRVLSLHKLRLFAGAAELLRRLRQQGKGVYLLSNAQALFTFPELEALGLADCFDGIMISSDVGVKKPDSRIYRTALERFGLDPARTVMVGNDDLADCWGACDAGLDSLYVYTEQSPVPARPLPENCRRLEDISRVF